MRNANGEPFWISHAVVILPLTFLRLDLKRKELIQQKEELLKETKAKNSTLDSVKSQIDTLLKVSDCFRPFLILADMLISAGRLRHSEESRRTCTASSRLE